MRPTWQGVCWFCQNTEPRAGFYDEWLLDLRESLSSLYLFILQIMKKPPSKLSGYKSLRLKSLFFMLSHIRVM